jgi:SAM-dependent methyltransferase
MTDNAADTRETLRATFAEVAELYDRARPGYPPELFDDLAELAGLRAGSRVVEIGCGTGIATMELAERGYDITCVELGEQLATVARRKLARFPNVEIVNENYETWQPAHSAFDAVVAFTAFHWIAPEARYEGSASILRPGGALAVVSTQHVLPADGDDFFRAVQEDYEQVLPEDPDTKRGAPVPPETVEHVLGREIGVSGYFRHVGARRYVWDVTYSADQYVSVLDTYSGHRALDAETRERLFSLIRRRIDARPEQRVRKTYLALLDVAERA